MGIENIDSDKLSGWASFINNLTPKKIILTVCLAVGLVFAYSLYEHKSTLPQLLSANPSLLYAMVGLIGLLPVSKTPC